MSLAISAPPGLGIVTAVTAALALWPRPVPPAPASPSEAHTMRFDEVIEDHPPQLSCEQAHSLILRGRVTDGGSHLALAGPILFANLTTDPEGFFFQRIPVEGDVCELLRQPAYYAFSDGSMRVSYSIELAR